MTPEEIDSLVELQESHINYDHWKWMECIPLKHIPEFTQELFNKSVDWSLVKNYWSETPESCSDTYISLIEASDISLDDWALTKKWKWNLARCDYTWIVYKMKLYPSEIITDTLVSYFLND